MTVGQMQITLGEHGGRQDSSLLGSAPRSPATDFEQTVCGAAQAALQAALRISRVVSDVVRAYGVAGAPYRQDERNPAKITT